MHRGGLFWGGILILLGVLLLLNRLGILSVGIWPVLWPLLLIGWGLSLLFGAFDRRTEEPRTENLALQLKGFEEAAVTIQYGAGRLLIDSGAAPDELLSGVFEGGVDHRLNPDGEVARVELRPPPALPDWNGRAWDIALNADIPLTLNLQIGAAEAIVNLAQTQVRSLALRAGAGQADIIMPASAGEVEATIEGGAGSVTVRVPDGVAARITGKATVGLLDVDESRFAATDTGWQSEAYEDASHRINLSVRFAAGQVSVL